MVFFFKIVQQIKVKQTIMKKILLTFVTAICVVAISSAASPLIKYAGEVNVGFATGGKLRYEDDVTMKSSLNRPFIETVHGVTITKYAFVGAGVGVQGYLGATDTDNPQDKWDTLAVPLFVNLKGMLPLKSLTPYISASLGGAVIPYSGQNMKLIYEGIGIKAKLTGGLYCDFGAGVKLFKNRLNVGIGLQHQQMGIKMIMTEGSYSESDDEDGYHGTSFYVKVGFCW